MCGTTPLSDSAYRDKLAVGIANGILAYLGMDTAEQPESGEPDQPSSWAEEAWKKAVALGIFDGTNPQGNLTREQVAVILDRLGLLPEQGGSWYGARQCLRDGHCCPAGKGGQGKQGEQ